MNVSIIVAYAPTADKPERELETFYSELTELLQKTTKEEITVILGDFNAKVGKGRVEDVCGEYGLGLRNERGDRLVQFCQEEDMTIANTWFKLPPRRLYTWRSPQDSQQHCVRNQIDYIMISKRFKNSIKAAKTYPGADVPSDHNLLVANISTRLKKLTKPIKAQSDIKLLRHNDIRKETTETINQELVKLGKDQKPEYENTETLWTAIKNILVSAKETCVINSNFNQKHKPWMTMEILQLMNERRSHRNRNNREYGNIHCTIRRKIREAKEEWAKDACKEIEELQERHDYYNIHKKVREVAGMYKGKRLYQLTNTDNKALNTREEITEEWENYIRNLFHDTRTQIGQINQLQTEASPDILMSEVRHAIATTKIGKAPGPDDVYIEVIKLIEEQNLGILTRLFNNIYKNGDIPQEWLTSVFVPIPKTRNPKTCDEFRLISLMSHMLKILLKIIHLRIYNKCEQDMGDEQFGFRRGMGTRDALCSLVILMQKCRDQQKDVYACFIDYEKAFDRVQHNTLLECLKKKGLDPNDINIIEKLYWQQTASVRTEKGISQQVEIQRGVRQGCVLSPLLFNLYSEEIFVRALSECEEGIKINGETVNNIRYADDTVIIAESQEALQNLLNRISQTGKEYGLNINVRKTKVMAVSKTGHRQMNIRLNDSQIEQVNKFKYLGCWITEDLNPDVEIRARIEYARGVFTKMKRLFCNRELTLVTRYRMIRCYIYSGLLYGMEAWTLKLATMRKIEAFEMWVFRRMLRVPWTEHATNDSILERVNRDRELLCIVKRRKTAYLGHILRNNKYRLLHLIIQGKIEGKRGPGRRQLSWMKNIRDWTHMNVETLIRTAQKREDFATVIANLR